MDAYVCAPKRRAWARGSSLFDLLVLFSLVGTVSAFAIPRYTRLANQARATQVIALSSVLRSVAQDAHLQFLASGSLLEAATLEGRPVSLKYGYPDTSLRGIRAVVIDWAGFTARSTSNSVVFMKKGAEVAEQCAVIYSIAEPQIAAESMTRMILDGC